MNTHEVYFIHDKDVDLYKIGYRGIKVDRFRSRSNRRQNRYITEFDLKFQTKPMSLTEAKSLEKSLHDQYVQQSCHYPAMTVTVTTATGEPLTTLLQPSGYTEWFKLGEAQVKEVMAYLTEYT
jgi:hypothetical protein